MGTGEELSGTCEGGVPPLLGYCLMIFDEDGGGGHAKEEGGHKANTVSMQQAGAKGRVFLVG